MTLGARTLIGTVLMMVGLIALAGGAEEASRIALAVVVFAVGLVLVLVAYFDGRRRP